MKLWKILLPLSILNVIGLTWAACDLPATVRLYLNAVPLFNFYTSRWLVPVLGLLPIGILFTLKSYFAQAKRENATPKAIRTGVVLYPALAVVFMLLPWFSVWMGHRDFASIQYAVLLVLGLLCAVLFAVMGNYSTTLAPNSRMGLNLPWTMEDPVIWRKVHRRLGILSIPAALLMALGGIVCFVTHEAAWFYALLAGALVLTPGVAILYAYQLHQNKKGEHT